MKVQKVDIDELHEMLFFMKERGVQYIDIQVDENINRLTLIESTFETGENSEIKLEDVI